MFGEFRPNCQVEGQRELVNKALFTKCDPSRKDLIIRDIHGVVKTISKGELDYLKRSEHGGGRVEEIFIRAQSMQEFGTKAVTETSIMGYFALFRSHV